MSKEGTCLQRQPNCHILTQLHVQEPKGFESLSQFCVHGGPVSSVAPTVELCMKTNSSIRQLTLLSLVIQSMSSVQCAPSCLFPVTHGPKHAKVNNKSGMPFTCDTFFTYNEGSKPNCIQNVIPRPQSPQLGFEPNIVQNLCLVSVVKIHMKQILN